MQDSFGRDIHYLRLSLTERCQLRCTYCRADEGCCPKEAELSTEAFIRIVAASARLGVTRVRLTGGEPLLRKDILQIVSGIAAIDGITDISATTNAQLLAGMAADLKAAGLNRLNISLDSLKADLFYALTGGDLGKVLRGIEEAILVGLLPVKINTVLLKGVNEGEVDDFIELTRHKPVDVRFIEYMPIGSGNHSMEKRISNRQLLVERPWLSALPPRYAGQPSEDYQLEGALGRVGFISPISHKFCHDCNRIRVMSDGKMRLCLGQESEVDLAEALEQDDLALEEKIKEAILCKPSGHNFDRVALQNRDMSRIGG